MGRQSLLPIRGARIAQFIESDGPGGAERMVGQLAGELQNGGCFAVAFLPADGEGWLGRELAAAGVAVEYVRLEHLLSPQLSRALAAALRRHRIDVVHSHEFTMALCGAWAARRAGLPHLITMHGGRYYAQRFRRRLALRAAIAFSQQLVAVSDPLAAHLSRDLLIRRTRITTIANGVRFTPTGRSSLRGELGLTDADRLAVAVGNLYAVKGHTYLLEAVAQLSSTYPQLHVALAGRRARGAGAGLGPRGEGALPRPASGRCERPRRSRRLRPSFSFRRSAARPARGDVRLSPDRRQRRGGRTRGARRRRRGSPGPARRPHRARPGHRPLARPAIRGPATRQRRAGPRGGGVRHRAHGSALWRAVRASVGERRAGSSLGGPLQQTQQALPISRAY